MKPRNLTPAPPLDAPPRGQDASTHPERPALRCPACDGPKPERFELVCERCRAPVPPEAP